MLSEGPPISATVSLCSWRLELLKSAKLELVEIIPEPKIMHPGFGLIRCRLVNGQRPHDHTRVEGLGVRRAKYKDLHRAYLLQHFKWCLLLAARRASRSCLP